MGSVWQKKLDFQPLKSHDSSSQNHSVPNSGNGKGKNMRARQTLQVTRLSSRNIVSLIVSLGTITAFAADDGSNNVPVWLRGASAHPTSRDISNAFHTSAPNPPAHQATILQGPVLD